MSSILGEWAEGKVPPLLGNTPRTRPVSRGILMLWSICDDPFVATRFPQLQVLPGPSVGVFKARRNLSGPMGFSKPTPKTKPKPTPGSGPYRLPLVGPESRSKNAPGG